MGHNNAIRDDDGIIENKLWTVVKDSKGKERLIEGVKVLEGFISHKSRNGKERKSLELPCLWNGAMSDWNTMFVDVPLATFNPVKTVSGLLREHHQ